MLRHLRHLVVRAPGGRRSGSGSCHLRRLAGIERRGSSDRALATGDDMIRGLNESKAGRGGQWYQLVGGDLAFSCPRHALVLGVVLVGGDFRFSLSAHRDLACGGSQGWAGCCDVPRQVSKVEGGDHV